MKHESRPKQGFDVFEFRDEDNPEPCDRWSKKLSQFDCPVSKYDGISKYQFLEKNSCGSFPQIKEVLTVTIDGDDDDDDGGGGRCLDSTDDNSAGPPDSLHKAGCKVSEGFYSMSDKALEQHRGFVDDSVDMKVLPPTMQMRDSSPLQPLPENGHTCSIIPESPCCDDDVDLGDLDGDDFVHESFPATFDSELEENYDPTVGQAHDQLLGGSEMDVMGTVTIHTDYVAFGDKYFPPSLIVISRDTVKMKASALGVESAASTSEWNVDDILKIETQWSSVSNVAKVRIRLMTRDAVHADSANGIAAVEMVEFLVPNWSLQQERIMSLNVRYSAVWSANMKGFSGEAVLLEDSECSSDPYIPNFEEPFEEVVYPKGEIDAVSVRKSDVDLLQPDIFVNDTIIDFYITYLKNKIPTERRHSFHFFSSFFFRKLADLDKNPSSISDGKAAFQRVRRWTRKINIFEKDYIFIPVNYNLHWSLIVLCHPGEVATFNDENIDEASKVPCILHMDSIRGSHAGLKDLLQGYLLEEWKERKKEMNEDTSSKISNLRFLSLELPQQDNCSDCGLFLLHYAELFIDEAPLNFNPFRINKFDYFLKPDWFIPAEASLKRVHIQKLIYELLKSRSHECVSPSVNKLLHSSALPDENDNGIEIISEKISLEKSWNQTNLYPDTVQDMDIGLLDMPMYRPSDCVDSSGLGLTELLGQCQQYDGGLSLGQLRYSMSSIREVDIDEHLPPNLGEAVLQPRNESRDSPISSSSGSDMESSELEEGEGILYSDRSSCDESDEEIMMKEYHSDIQSDDSCQNESINESKENVDSQEGYASAPSDMMETPPEDSQELADKYGNHDREEEVVQESQEEFRNNGDEGAVNLSNSNEKLTVENGKVDGDEGALDVSDTDEKLTVEDGKVEEMLIVQDSPDYQFRPAKKLRHTPSCSEVRQLL